MSARSSAAHEIMSIKAVALRDAVRRALNIAGSVVLLALTLPLMVLAAWAIRLRISRTCAVPPAPRRAERSLFHVV